LVCVCSLLLPHSTMCDVCVQPGIASPMLLHTCLDSCVDSRQFTNLQHLYCENLLTAETCARLLSVQSYLAYFVAHVCYLSRLSSNTYMELRETDLSVNIYASLVDGVT